MNTIIINKLNFSLEKFIIFFAILFSLSICLKIIYLTDGFILNNFPRLSSDSFDYIVEAYAIHNYLTGGDFVKLEVLRNPILVLLLVGDLFLWGKGYLIGISYALCFYFQFFYSLKILTLVKKATNFDHLVILFAVFLMPINSFKYFILSETLAITFLLMTSYLSLAYYLKNEDNKLSIFNQSLLALVIGSLTQIYVLIPFLCIHFFFNLRSLWLSKKLHLSSKCLLRFFLAIALILTILFFWRQIPHKSIPNTFSLLGFFKPHVVSFYIYFWPYHLFIAIIPFLFALSKPSALIDNAIKQCCILIILLHMLLCLSYNWIGDPRFTLIFIPWIYIYFLMFSNRFNLFVKSNIILLLLAFSFAPSPAFHKNKNVPLYDLNFSINYNYLFSFLKSEKTQRLDKCCKTENERKNFLTSTTNYQSIIFNYYFNYLDLEYKKHQTTD